VSQEPLGAVDAFSRITPYSIDLQTLAVPGNPGLGIPYRVIVREPTPDDQEFRVFGIVGPEYQLVDPLAVCEAYDQAVNREVETIGCLGFGETLFLTTKLPDMDIKGDLVENYLLIVSPYDGFRAMQIRVTPVRVVCQNTLIAAKRASSEVYRVVHDQYAQSRLEAWLSGLYDRAVARVDLMQQSFEMFAGYQPSTKGVTSILNKIYPEPNTLRENAPQEVLDRRMVDYEYYRKAAERSKEAVLDLFNGKGTGSDLISTKGTGWGLYNAVVEYEDYRPTSKKDESSRLVNSLFGDRANAKERAYVTIEDYAKKATR
jgi:phage/plasmid-like protein (TIGR03299 family)